MLLTRPPLALLPKEESSFDLHVLGTPPAFILSQDQTRHPHGSMRLPSPSRGEERSSPGGICLLLARRDRRVGGRQELRSRPSCCYLCKHLAVRRLGPSTRLKTGRWTNVTGTACLLVCATRIGVCADAFSFSGGACKSQLLFCFPLFNCSRTQAAGRRDPKVGRWSRTSLLPHS